MNKKKINYLQVTNDIYDDRLMLLKSTKIKNIVCFGKIDSTLLCVTPTQSGQLLTADALLVVIVYILCRTAVTFCVEIRHGWTEHWRLCSRRGTISHHTRRRLRLCCSQILRWWWGRRRTVQSNHARRTDRVTRRRHRRRTGRYRYARLIAARWDTRSIRKFIRWIRFGHNCSSFCKRFVIIRVWNR